MTTTNNILESIQDLKPVRAFLPITDSKERYRAQCIFQKTTAPDFNLLFKVGVLPSDSLNLKETCIINIDQGGTNLSLEAMVKNVVNGQTLEMVVRKSIDHEQMREFFRVDAITEVIGKSFHPQFFDSSKEQWSLVGKTIDISGSGILASFSEAPPMDTQTRLELALPTEKGEPISILATPVRCQQIGDNHFDVAYHFDEITTEDRDRIIGCCLVIQRKMLRLKVQVRG